MSFHVRNERRAGLRFQAPNARQEWVPRGSANAPPPAATPVNPPSSFNLNSNGNGGDSNNSTAAPDSRVRNGRRFASSHGCNGLSDHVPVPRANHGPRGHSSRPMSQRRGKEKEKDRSGDPLDESKFFKDPNLPQLVQEIQEKLTRGAVECMICYEMVRRTATIWSCSSCYSIFHLNCIKKWARAPTSVDLSAEKSSGNNWRCPGCQRVQLTSSKEIQYLCFCGKRTDPPSDLYLTPHSCGEPCGKPLERNVLSTGESAEDLCPHVCVLQCHPGPCPPCKQFAPPRVCPCGKETITTRCSDRKPVLTCGQRCDKLLDCGRHQCERSCHVGPCDPCQVLFNASCFCKKKVEVVLCGDMAVKGEVDMESGVFSCTSSCGKKLSCGNHDCLEVCHPGPCGDCALTPGKVRTCYCGNTNLQMEERKSCLDPIPTCSEVCGKLLPCKIHSCKDKCHAGDCGPCPATVTQKCRCGLTSRTVKCYQTVEESFTCDKPCGRKKNCGRHRCSERCCPLSNSSSSSSRTGGEWDPHFCSMPCGKKLRCGQHSCETLCHSGHCPPCLETIFTDLTCACGRTSIPPPLPCGTPPPSCQLPCSAPQPCGHSSSHSCHFGECPPCSVPVAKECVGGHVILRNIPCGSKDIRCNKLCGKTRQCGLHACGRTCHPPPCDMNMPEDPNQKGSCGQICGAPRRDCRHTCKAPCHPLAPCPDNRCDFSATITCSCGRLSATVPCDAGGLSGNFATDNVFEASIIQKLPAPLQPVESTAGGKKVPLGQRKLMCDEECSKLERKRLLADAFDIATPNLEALHFGESSTISESVMDLFRRDPKWVMAVEERCKFLVLGKGRTGSNGLKVHVFCPMLKEKRDAVRLIAGRWKLAVNSAGWEPKRFVVVHVTSKSKPPSRVLGVKTVNSPHPPVFDPLVDMDPRLVVSFFDLPRESDITGLVLRFGGECELVWLNDKNALAVFGDPARAATALRRLDHGSVYYGVAVVVVQNGPPSALGANVWGGAAVSASSKGNPWKKAVIQEAGWKEEDDWSTRNSSSDLQATVLSGKEPPISASVNRWSVLDSETGNRTSASSVPSSSLRIGDSSKPAGGTSHSSSVSEAANPGMESSEVVDDWEKAYD
ncbi:hypothetical protein CDL15_Pgr019947 [Punica granatum]|nr:hypothetical protein CDL15_Pgr019947 [Punica granatum]